MLPRDSGSAYNLGECQDLCYSKPTPFPIMHLINNIDCAETDLIQIIIIVAHDSEHENTPLYASHWADVNYEAIVTEVKEIIEAKNIKSELNIIKFEVPMDECSETHLQSFLKLIDYLDKDNNVIFSDITYGAKPTTLLTYLALSYAINLRENISVERIIYGLFNFTTHEKTLYDCTSLFQLDKVISSLGAHRNHINGDPKKIISALLLKENE